MFLLYVHLLFLQNVQNYSLSIYLALKYMFGQNKISGLDARMLEVKYRKHCIWYIFFYINNTYEVHISGERVVYQTIENSKPNF